MGRRKREYIYYDWTHPRTGKIKKIKIAVPKKEEKKKKPKRSSKKTNKEYRDIILKRDKHKCVECGCKQRLQVHHIVPRSKGGTDEPSNLLTLCDICHMEKHRGEIVYNIMIKNLFIYETV